MSITEFLNTAEQDYQEGISLLAEYCRNATMLNSLRKRESERNWEMLLYQLEKHADAEPLASRPERSQLRPSRPMSAPVKIAPAKSNDAAQAPAMQALSQKLDALRAEKAALSDSLLDDPSQESRKAKGERIRDLEAEMNPLFAAMKTGRLPVSQEEIQERKEEASAQVKKASAEDARKLGNLKSQRSKAKKKLDALKKDSPDYRKYAAKLEKLEPAIKELEDAIEKG